MEMADDTRYIAARLPNGRRRENKILIDNFGIQNALNFHSKSIQIFIAVFIDFWLHFGRFFQACSANFSMVFWVLVEKAGPYESIAPASQIKGPGPSRSLQKSLKLQLKNQ